MRTGLLVLAICGMLMASASAQVASPAQPEPDRSKTPAAAQPSFTPPTNVSPLLSKIEQTAMTTNGDIARLRIEKWKADGGSKRQAAANAESLQRNLTAALPGMISAVRSSPDNLAASFKLYRNLDALYDVLGSLAESAGAFGPKEDYQALATDADNLQQLRRQMADQVETLATFKDNEVSQLMLRIRTQAAAAAAAPPKKVVIDEEEQPAKKPARKKKAPAKTAPAPAQSQTPPPQAPPPKQ